MFAVAARKDVRKYQKKKNSLDIVNVFVWSLRCKNEVVINDLALYCHCKHFLTVRGKLTIPRYSTRGREKVIGFVGYCELVVRARWVLPKSLIYKFYTPWKIAYTVNFSMADAGTMIDERRG